MDLLSRCLLRLPMLGSWYARHAATVKRDVCLALDRLGLLRPITFVQWLATYACNGHCPFCEASAGEPLPDELTADEVRALIDDLAGLGARRLVVSGGEPLLRGDVVELMGYARRRGIAVGLVTNGYLVEERWPELRSLDYFLYFTSLDGPPRYHDRSRGLSGGCERALNGLARFAEIGTPTRIVNTVVHPGNLHLLGELLEIVRGSAATRWHLTPAASVGRASTGQAFTLDGAGLRHVMDFVRSASSKLVVDLGESHGYLWCLDGGRPQAPFFCGAGLTRCAVMPEGSVLPCQQVYDLRLAEGNVRSRPFSVIWREGFRDLRRRRAPEGCGPCPHLAACRGGCWAERTLQRTCLQAVWEAAGDAPATLRQGSG